MPVDKSLLSHWREVPAVDVLTALADHAKRDVSYIALKSPLSSRWHARYGSREFELLLTGPKFWDTRERKGGGGALDLAMHLAQVNFSEAVRLLQSHGL
ncbi:hypothetical protein M3I53_20325 [Paraburkholderia sp. CNPSo 3272]|uniref:hypothetical protein n=1 Tax=Paraburkholderia sp. CNPSo 3272 TaxID=2940931 RepID=UPI0020B7514F|nr:hypothetical protein [Paraburkholderia sp. CNPSo 3272]MCP3725440.1 hypothetical protein [Paraburkholderia sp. CNPSo 3272]